MKTQDDLAAPPFTAELVFGDGTPKKALLTALVVGSALVAINHIDLLLDGITPPLRKIVLTYFVPYCVTTWGAVTAKRTFWSRANAA
jgi:hypothetical protein